MRKSNQVMHRPNHASLTAVKMGYLQITITKLITWTQVQDPSFPTSRYCAPTSQGEMS